MSALSPIPEKGYKIELKWLMFFRVLFSLVLLGATTVLQLGETATPLGHLFWFLRLYHHDICDFPDIQPVAETR